MNRLMFVAVLVVAVVGVFTSSVNAEWEWKHFGTDPYAISREAAMWTRASAFRTMGFPEQVVNLFEQATLNPGETVRLSVNDRLSTMLSKGGVVHQDVVIKFDPPSPGMQYVAMAEKWQISWEGKIYSVLLPATCFNWSSIIASAPVAAKPATISPVPAITALPASTPRPRSVMGACPDGYSLIANVWSLAALPPDLRRNAEEHIANAKERDSRQATNRVVYETDDVSRTIGGQLRREVKVRASVGADLKVFYRDPVTLKVVQDLGVLRVVSGTGSIRFSDDPRKWIVEAIWPAGDFLSPTVSGDHRRLWVFPNEWGTWCAVNAHGIVP
ncbi:MAG: hypothetical protein V1763_01320 [Parcubacteria group bacterium]